MFSAKTFIEEIMSSFSGALLDGLILCSDAALMGSFISLFLQIRIRRSAVGISLQTLGAVVVARTLHLISHPTDLHFSPVGLPFAIFMLFDYVNVFLGISLVLYIFKNYLMTYESKKDSFSQRLLLKLGLSESSASVLRFGFIYVLAAVFGIIWHFVRRSHHTFIVSYFCCYYEALCAVALLPQLWMFQQDRVVSPQLANFVALTAFNRFFTLLFWVSYPYVYPMRFPDNRGVQMTSEILNLLILSDFLFYFVRAKIRGQKLVVIPNAGSSEV